MRLTRAGWGLLSTTLACAVVGRFFGTIELYYLAATALACLLLALAYVAIARLDLSIQRTATPARLRVGTPARIDLALTNRSRLPTPALRLDDELGSGAPATLHIAPIRHGQTCEVAYQLPTRSRGVLGVGPLHLVISDPLGLMTSRVRASGAVELVVHATLHELPPLHASAGSDPTADQQTSRALAVGGDEFFALRPYVVGDELRRVHWPTSARLDELVVKQEERARTGRVTVLFDQRREAYTDEGFERAVSAALSVLTAGWRGDDALRFATTAAPGFTDLRSKAELDAVDEQLALVTPTASASLIRTLDQVCRTSRGGTLVLVTGRPTERLDAALDQARRAFGTVNLVVCEPHDASVGASTLLHRTVTHDGTSDFAQAWRNR